MRVPAYFAVGDVFKAYDMGERLRYVCITAALEGLLYDLKECDRNGKPVRLPYRKAGVRHEEIINRLLENDWRLIKTLQR